MKYCKECNLEYPDDNLYHIHDATRYSYVDAPKIECAYCGGEKPDCCRFGPLNDKPIEPGDVIPWEKGSIKHDNGKVDPTMLTWEMVEAVSKVRMFGAKKYGRGNFKKTGFKYTRSLAASLRHIFAFLRGEDNDPESGISHLAHAICCLEHCIYDTVNHPENDDREE